MATKKQQQFEATEVETTVVTDEPEILESDFTEPPTEESEDGKIGFDIGYYRKFLVDFTNGERFPVFFRDHCQRVLTVDFLDQPNVKITKEDNTGTFAAVSLNDVSDLDASLYVHLFETLGLTPDKFPNNIGLVAYDENNKFKWFTYPTISLVDGQISLVIGASSKDSNLTSVSVPLIRNEDEEGVYYTLNGKRCDCTVLGEGDYQIAFVRLKTNLAVFHFTVRVDKDTRARAVEQAFDSGKLSEVVKGLGGEAVVFQKMFQASFENGTFPKHGILLILTNGKKTENTFEGKTVVGSQWTLKAYPGVYEHLEVETITKEADPLTASKNKKKMTALANVTTIFMSGTANPTKLCIDRNETIPILYLYVMGPHLKNSGRTPEHTAVLNAKRLPPVALEQARVNNMLQLPSQVSSVPENF